MKHFTYINQFFGNDAVREVIQKIHSQKDLQLEVEPLSTGEMGQHHRVKIGNGIENACSVNSNIQNILIDKNDTLCQSYSLLYYLKYPDYNNEIYKDKLRRQYEMIKMYRELLYP